MRRSLFLIIALMVCLIPVTADDLPEAVSLESYHHTDGMPRPVVTFRPVGWSPDGLFAYMSARNIDGRGGRITRFVIVSVVTDEEVFLVEYDDFMDDETKPTMGGYDVHFSLFLDALGQYGIETHWGIAFQDFPLNSPNGSYQAEIITTAETHPDAFMDEIGSYEVWVTKDGESSKRITRSNDVHALDMGIAGYFASPFENRILVVYYRDSFTFEGSEYYYGFSGCHLDYGF